MILLECPETGERQLVRNAAGYKGWRLISRKAPRPESDHCVWCEESGAWKDLHEEQKRAARIAALRDPEVLLAIIEQLHGGIDALDAIIATNRKD